VLGRPQASLAAASSAVHAIAEQDGEQIAAMNQTHRASIKRAYSPTTPAEYQHLQWPSAVLQDCVEKTCVNTDCQCAEHFVNMPTMTRDAISVLLARVYFPKPHTQHVAVCRLNKQHPIAKCAVRHVISDGCNGTHIYKEWQTCKCINESLTLSLTDSPEDCWQCRGTGRTWANHSAEQQPG